MKPSFFLAPLFLVLFITTRAQPFQYTVTQQPGAPGGYYYVAPITLFGGHSQGMILDSVGKLLYYRNFLNMPVDFKLQPNGQLSCYHLNGFLLFDGQMKVADSVRVPTSFSTDVHELEILPNGHYLLLGLETFTLDLSGYPIFSSQADPTPAEAQVMGNVIFELDAARNIVFEWHAKDHFKFEDVDFFWLSNSTVVDWTHSNSVTVDTDGNYILSSRHLNELTKINKSNGNIIWRFGGKNNQFSFIGDTIRFYGQHHARRLPNGHLTVFDNGRNVVTHPARAAEFELDETNLTAKLVWSYSYKSMYSTAMGSVQRLSTGNTVVNYGLRSAENICFNVVDQAGDEVFSFTAANGRSSYRAFNETHLPSGFTQPQVYCRDSSGVTILEAAAGYDGYKWSTGDTTRAIKITAPGNYDYFATLPWGGFIRSREAGVADQTNFCNLAGISHPTNSTALTIYPNPASDYLTVSGVAENLPVVISDSYGRQISCHTFNSDGALKIDVSGLDNGIYFVRTGKKVNKFVKE